MSKRPRGTGSVYRYKNSGNWWLKYYKNGVAVREPSGTDSETQAKKLLNKRIGEVAAGNDIEPSNRKLTIDQLYEFMLTNYRINNKIDSHDAAEARWQRQPLLGESMPEAGRLKKKFSGMLAIALTTDKIEKYIEWCQQQGLSNATINRDIACLRHAFKLALKAGKLSKAPHFPTLEENPPREGFLEYWDYLKLREHAHELWLRAIVVCCYEWGIRKGELVGHCRKEPPFADGLKVCDVDMMARTIRLKKTKNGPKKRKDRIVPMNQDIYPLIVACCQGKKPDDFVFTRPSGEQVKEFRKRWARLKREAGVRGDLFIHDNRRSAVRNMERAGIPRSVAMKISGHETESVYRRYAIVNESQLHDAAKKLDAAKQEWAEFGQSLQESTSSSEKPKRLN